MGAPAWRLAAAAARGIDPGDDRAGDRAADRTSRLASADDRKDSPSCRVHQSEGSRAREGADRIDASPLLLLRLSAQHVDQRSRGQPRDRPYRLSRAVDLDGSEDLDV